MSQPTIRMTRKPRIFGTAANRIARPAENEVKRASAQLLTGTVCIPDIQLSARIGSRGDQLCRHTRRRRAYWDRMRGRMARAQRGERLERRKRRHCSRLLLWVRAGLASVAGPAHIWASSSVILLPQDWRAAIRGSEMTQTPRSFLGKDSPGGATGLSGPDQGVVDQAQEKTAQVFDQAQGVAGHVAEQAKQRRRPTHLPEEPSRRRSCDRGPGPSPDQPDPPAAGAGHVAGYVEEAAQRVESMMNYLRAHEVHELGRRHAEPGTSPTGALFGPEPLRSD